MQMQYDKATLHSGNVYQIFAYVKNQDASGNGKVSGMLLYAKTDGQITPDYSYMMSGNKISANIMLS
jgi:5-methylcytosine-specific restriction enzyme subunit McrC